MQETTPIIIKKKKGHAHGHHGGAWKVAYADFVTAMMAFFLVMWIMGMSEDTKVAVAGYFNDPGGFMRNTPRTRNILPMGQPFLRKGAEGRDDQTVRDDVRQFQEIKGDLEGKLRGGGTGAGDGVSQETQALVDGVEVRMTSQGLEINFVEKFGEVFFDLGSPRVRPAARRIILEVAPILAESRRAMFIDGHTDGRIHRGRNYDGKLLSSDRAEAVYWILRTGGVREEQVLGLRGFADKMLRRPDDPYHFSNRRVSILLPYRAVAHEISDLPGEILSNTIQARVRPPEARVNLRPEDPGIRELAQETAP